MCVQCDDEAGQHQQLKFPSSIPDIKNDFLTSVRFGEEHSTLLVLGLENVICARIFG